MTRFHELPDGASLAYDDAGSGRPVVLLHGVCMSRRFFAHNTGELAGRFRVVSVDFRGHGESPAHEGGHRVAQYARDVHHLIGALGLEDPVLVGWSMGTFAIWDYLRQFGDGAIAAHVNVSQGPSDLKRDDWELGAFALDEVFEALAAAQDDFRGFMDEFLPAMFMHETSPEVHADLLAQTQRVGANAGACILLDQCLQDYREQVTGSPVRTLLCWGADEKLIAVANGEWLAANQAAAELVVFEQSGHCPMWEQPGDFNRVVGDWIAAL